VDEIAMAHCVSLTALAKAQVGECFVQSNVRHPDAFTGRSTTDGTPLDDIAAAIWVIQHQEQQGPRGRRNATVVVEIQAFRRIRID
jgi:hypothetical protein